MEAPRVRLERPAASHGEAFIAAVLRSRALHADFVAPPETPRAYRRFLRQARLVSETRFLVVTAAERRLAGVVTLGGILRGPEGSASLGYYAFEPYARRGLIGEAAGLAIAHGFETLGLGRLDASIRPDNDRSRRFAARLGFVCDDLEPHAVRIGGRWYAHERWTLRAEDWRAARASAARTRLGPRRAEAPGGETVEVHWRRQSQ